MIKIEFYSWLEAQVWARPIRIEVFVCEQGICEAEEWDEYDQTSLHGIAWLDGLAVGCVRLLPDGKVGRLAVLKRYRRCGVARKLMQEVLRKARQLNHRQVVLSAQFDAMGLYKKLGFVAFGEPHFEVNIAHQWMRLSID